MMSSSFNWTRLILSVLVAGTFGFGLLLLGAEVGWWQLYAQTPAQPINFPHTQHAGELGLDCTYCHAHVEESRHAGAPPLELCMDCHEGVATEKPEIQKLTRYYNEGTPVEWARIHNLPQYVYFSHKRHLKGGVDCSNCHGAVKQMEVIRQVRPLNMGWCVACHRAYDAPLECSTCHK